MGMYTEFHFYGTMKSEGSLEAREVLAALFDYADVGAHGCYIIANEPARWAEPRDVILRAGAGWPDHAFFSTPRGRRMCFCTEGEEFTQNSHLDGLYVQVHCKFKNYNDEIQLFIEWLGQWLDPEHPCFWWLRYEDSHGPLVGLLKPDGSWLAVPNPSYVNAMSWENVRDTLKGTEHRDNAIRAVVSAFAVDDDGAGQYFGWRR